MFFARLLIAVFCLKFILQCQANRIKNGTELDGRTNGLIAGQSTKAVEIFDSRSSFSVSMSIGPGVLNSTAAPNSSSKLGKTKKINKNERMIASVSVVAENGYIHPEKLREEIKRTDGKSENSNSTVNLTPINSKLLLEDQRKFNRHNEKSVEKLECKSQDRTFCESKLLGSQNFNTENILSNNTISAEHINETELYKIKPICFNFGSCPTLLKDEPLSGLIRQPNSQFMGPRFLMRPPNRIPESPIFRSVGPSNLFPGQFPNFQYGRIDPTSRRFQRISENNLSPRQHKMYQGEPRPMHRRSFGVGVRGPRINPQRNDRKSNVIDQSKLSGHRKINNVGYKSRPSEQETLKVAKPMSDRKNAISSEKNINPMPYMSQNPVPNFANNRKVWRKSDLEKSIDR